MTDFYEAAAGRRGRRTAEIERERIEGMLAAGSTLGEAAAVARVSIRTLQRMGLKPLERKASEPRIIPRPREESPKDRLIRFIETNPGATFDKLRRGARLGSEDLSNLLAEVMLERETVVWDRGGYRLCGRL